MLKPIALTAEQVRQPTHAAPSTNTANTVFKVLHGFYGNLFLSKYATGELDAEGNDGGMVNARRIWAHGLREFDTGVVRAALSQVMDRHPEFPPSLPQFVAICKAHQPREAYKPPAQALGMSGQLRSKYAAQARDIIARHHALAVERLTGARELPCTLDGLKVAIAGAVAAAGGNEVATLRRLDVLLAPKSKAVA